MDRTQSRFDERLKWLCAIVLLGWALFALVYAANTARLPMQFDYEEGNILNAGLRITHGQTPYPQPSSWPSASPT